MADPYPAAVVTNKAFYSTGPGTLRSPAVVANGDCYVTTSTSYLGKINCSTKTFSQTALSSVFLGLFMHRTKDNYLLTPRAPAAAHTMYKMTDTGTFVSESTSFTALGYGLGTTLEIGNHIAEHPSDPIIYFLCTKSAGNVPTVCIFNYSTMTPTFNVLTGTGGQGTHTVYEPTLNKFFGSHLPSGVYRYTLAGAADGSLGWATLVFNDLLYAFGKLWVADRGATQYLHVGNPSTLSWIDNTQHNNACSLATNGTHIFLDVNGSVKVIDPTTYSTLQTISGTIADVGATRSHYMQYNSVLDQLIIVNANLSPNNNVSFIDLNTVQPPNAPVAISAVPGARKNIITWTWS